MELQKIVNFLNTDSDENLPRFVAKNGLKFMINHNEVTLEITLLMKKLESKH